MLARDRIDNIISYAERMGFQTISKPTNIAAFTMELTDYLKIHRPECHSSVNTINEWMRAAGEPGVWKDIPC